MQTSPRLPNGRKSPLPGKLRLKAEDRRSAATREKRLLAAVASSAAAFLDDADFGSVIDRGLRLLGEGAGVDRVTILAHDGDPTPDKTSPGWLQTRYVWNAPGVAELFPMDTAARLPYLPGLYERLRGGDPCSQNVSELSKRWQSELALTGAGVQSFAVVPISLEKVYWGTICFDSCRQTRRWLPAEMGALRAAAACLGGALARESARQRATWGEHRSRVLFEQSPLSMQLFSPDGRCLAANRAWEKLWQAPASSVLGMTNLFATKQMQDLGLSALLARAAAGEIVFCPPFFYDPTQPGKASLGRPRRVEGFFFPLKDESGQVREILVAHRDVTDLHQAHAALTEANIGLRQEVAERRRAEELARGQTDALTRALTLLSADPVLDSFLGQVLTAVTEQLGAPAATLYFHDPVPNTLVLHMTYDQGQVFTGRDQLGHPNALSPFPADLNGFWRVLVKTRRPLEIFDVENDPLLEHHDWLTRAGVRSLLIAPLVSGQRVMGLLGVRFYEGPRHCQRQELDLAQALAQLATLAVELTRLGGEAQVRAIVEERNRLAREIHDTIAQGLVGILVQLQVAKREILARNTTAGVTHIERALELAEIGLAEARCSVRALRPELFEEGRDLVGAFQTLLDRLPGSVGTEKSAKIEFSWRGRRRSLPEQVEEDLLRIGQEALTNALTHAGAQRIRLSVAFTLTGVRVGIADNGRGFDPKKTLARPGNEALAPRFGLRGMRERAARLNARFSLRSQAGQGTRISVSVPVPVAGMLTWPQHPSNA